MRDRFRPATSTPKVSFNSPIHIRINKFQIRILAMLPRLQYMAHNLQLAQQDIFALIAFVAVVGRLDKYKT